MTFDAATGPYIGAGATDNIFGAYGSLSGYATTVSTTAITSTYHSVDNWQPDVAGIRTDVLTPHNVGIFTWLNQCNCRLYTLAWDPNTGAISGAATFSAAGLSDPFSHPRIDANDDHNTNFTPGNSNFKIVTEHLGTTYMEVESYDFGTGGAGVLTSGWIDLVLTFNADHYAPAVAFGPLYSQYMVTEITDEGPSPGNNVYMIPVDMTDPTNIALDPSSASSVFLVNNTVSYIDALTTNYANAVSTACNNVADTSLVTWADFDGTNYNIWYKRSGYDWGSTGHYYKKMGNQA